MKKINILRIILVILILCWMYMVFSFSAADGETSSGLSLKVAEIFSNDEEVIEIIVPIIRKLAHLSEYALGGFLIFGLFSTYNIDLKKQIIFSGLFGIIYAITDEIHQLFVDGRSSRIADVCIDTIGVLLGIFILLFIEEIVKRICNKNKKEEKEYAKF